MKKAYRKCREKQRVGSGWETTLKDIRPSRVKEFKLAAAATATSRQNRSQRNGDRKWTLPLAKKENGRQKSENSREIAENLSQKRVPGDTLPMCSPNLQIELDSKRCQKRQAHSLALKSSSSLQRLSFCPSFDEQSRKAKLK